MLQQGDIDAHTALEWACYSGHLNIVRYLMRDGQVSPTVLMYNLAIDVFTSYVASIHCTTSA
jgi:ankyrin repeat protein